MFVRLFRIKASESLEKSLAGAIYKEENGETETKRALDYLGMAKLQARHLYNSCHRVSSLR